MKKDNTEDQYKKITQELNEEKMNWDFEDFLEKTKQEEKVIPLVPNKKGGSFPKTFWMAASVILLVSIGIFFNYESGNTVSENDQLVQNEIKKQKDSFRQESNLAVNAINDSLKIKSDSIISDSTRTVEQIDEADIMDQIIPKRGRIYRNSRQRYAEVSIPKDNEKTNSKTPKYESSYVIINGQKIENEQEAIDLTKYSFRILSENVSKTVAQTEVLNSFTNDY
ncbi:MULTISPECIES: hypothetical protein [unclassified Kaistella]|uniref:hypothetical protein n=1 Tax=unclassified Kaistella TaxID=2762626 RepID=UPI002735C2E7|nr:MULTISPECIES: hypothetical protein [unclassified Kaistella]MDP2454276.1 hypothetical protein [Kaistella sp. SH11-4b]MDP2457653.1 hypothetical protein [Kaistella sp. SH40-3]MDP2460411.1 hypothetical protein [Kaistella sp. SH19-2b]